MHRIDALRERYPTVPVTEESIRVSAPALADAEERVTRESNAAVGAVVRDEADRVLLVSNAWSDGWIVPGGLAKPGESLATAAKWEVREETGVDATIERPVEFRRQRLQNADGTNEVTMWFVGFLGRVESDAPAVAVDPGEGDEVIERVEWFETVPDDCADETLLELAGVLG